MSFKTFIQFVSILRVEPYMILMTFSAFFRKTPLEVLIQDKLCTNRYNMSDEFCYYLPYITANDANHEIKTAILSDAVTYNMYHTWITMAPGIVWSLFLGPWIDKYISGRKVIFIVGSITQTLEAAINTLNSYYFDSNVNWILVSFIPYTLSGSMVRVTAYSYIAATTPTKLRTIRMTIFEVLNAFAVPLGVFISGKLINGTPVGGNGQLHNTGLIFFISSCIAFLAFIWSVFAINQQKDKQMFDKYFSERLDILDKTVENDNNDSNNNNNYTNSKNSESNRNTNNTKELENNERESIHPLRLLFDIKNAKEIVMTCARHRANYVRAQIWLIIMAMFCGYFIAAAPGAFFFQFIEKIYYWDASTFTQFAAMGMIVNSVIIIFLTPLLIKVLKLNEMYLAIIGFCGAMLHMLALGAILSPVGYLLGIVTGTTAPLGSIGFKTHLSNIVEPSELGKVFTLMGVVDGFAPLIAAAIFTVVFEETIDSSVPGTCFLILAAICVVPILIALVIDYIITFKVKISYLQNTQNNEGIYEAI